MTLILRNIPIPTSTLKDHVKKVTSDLIYILNKHKPLIPGLIYNDPITVALEQLTTLLNRNIKPEINSAHFQG